MPSVLRITPGMLPQLHPINAHSLVGEDVLLRIGRSGFTLGYVPLNRAQWRAFPPSPKADPAKLLSNQQAALFAAFDDGSTLIGQAAVLADPHTGWAEVLDIRVDATHRRSGIASLLLEACQGFAADQGMRGLCIFVPDTNPAACQFCEHCGFTLQGLDRMALAYTETERDKPLALRAALLSFYKLIQKG